MRQGWSGRKRINILGVEIDAVNMNEAVQAVEGFLQDGEKHQIVTPNPEFIMQAQKDEEFRKILNSADLAIADGVGLLAAAKFLSWPIENQPVGFSILQVLWQGVLVGFWTILDRSRLDVLPEQVTGADLIEKLARKTGKLSLSYYFLGGASQVAQRAQQNLQRQYPGLVIKGAEEGFQVDNDGEAYDPADEEAVIERINLAAPNILWVSFGAPKQEKWIARNLSRLNVKIAIGVGGGIDFVAGVQKRAPIFFRRFSLEWFWRLLTAPSRIKRIITAVFVFPLAVARHKLKMV